MARGEFTKEEAVEMEECLKEIMESLPKKKAGEYIGHFNDLFLFLNAAKKVAPTERESKEREEAKGKEEEKK